MKLVFLLLVSFAALAAARTDMERALDRQDRAALEKLAVEASKKTDAASQYQAALAYSYLAQAAMEAGDKAASKTAAETGMGFARKAVEAKGDNAEYRRILGTLCGQVIPANVLAGMKHGRCAMDEVNKAVELAPKSSIAWVSHGVGNYYLPAAFGGGVDKAILDFEKAAQLDPKSAEAHLWLGIALRKAGKNADARKALEKSLQLNPERAWAKQQWEKTPAK